MMLKTKPFLTILLSISGIFCQAQSSRITDSLQQIITYAKEDTVKANALISLSKANANVAKDLSLSLAKQAFDLSTKIHFVKGQAYALKYIGLFYYGINNVEALDNWLRSLVSFRSIHDKLGEANMLNNIGSLYYNQADDAKALDYYLQSLNISEELGDKLRIATALQNIGNVYQRKKATQNKALQYFLRALPISDEIQNHDASVVINTNIGEVYLSMNNVDSSLFYYKRALAASKNAEEVTTTFILNNIGRAYDKRKEYATAIQYQQRAVQLAKKFNAKLFIGKSLLGLGDTYFDQGDNLSALSSYKEAEQPLKDEHAVEELKDLYAGFNKVYAKNGDFSKGFYYLTLYSGYKDSLYNIETDKKLSNLQLDFDIAKKETQIKLLTKDQALQDLELKRQKTTRNAFAGGFILILIIAFGIYRSYREKVKTNVILDKQKLQIENLMHNILPAEVAKELRDHGHATPRHYDCASVLFTDFKSFTSLADKMTPNELLAELNESFIAFDDIIGRNDLEKIKTIGDSYMCAGGIPTPNEFHAVNMVKAGLQIQKYMAEKNIIRSASGLAPWELRLGIHVGPIVAGVVGRKKYAYDIWGSTVNIASRMESNSEPGRVNISASTYELVKDVFVCSHRGKIHAKNIGEIDMYFVEGYSEIEHEKTLHTVKEFDLIC